MTQRHFGPGVMKATTDQIVQAYRETGSVWRAAKKLGMAGQSVHERLVVIGHPLDGHKWTNAEVDELRALAVTCTIGEIARRLGRTYAGIACKMSELEIASGTQRPRKIPRGAGFDKATVKRHMKALAGYRGPITHYCRSRSITIDLLVAAIQKLDQQWWDDYAKARNDLPSRECEYCNRVFYPTSGKQRTCSRKCASDALRDRHYFGGNRRNTIGLAAGICQLCGRTDVKGLASHHLVGKENDPDNALLIALCPGCHQLVGILASRTFVYDVAGWENLINLVMHRRGAGKAPGYYTTVEIEALTDEQLSEELAFDDAVSER